ncbi:MAG TPA: ferrous iron transport protein A [Longimicrobiales bacterium]|nr:ferrous iron transport protein A [Longimicrobiales bacterium]
MARFAEHGRATADDLFVSGLHPRLPWMEALASAKPGRRYRIEDILFSVVSDRCRELGCVPGDELVCMENDGDGVSIVGPDGRWKLLEREYAWFVRVEPVGTGMWLS